RLVAAAPMFVATRNSEEISWSYPLFARIIFIQIGALNYGDPDVAGVSVHSRVVSRHEFRECSMGALARVPPERCHGDASSWNRLECRAIGGHIDDLLVATPPSFLRMHSTRHPGNDQSPRTQHDQ